MGYGFCEPAKISPCGVCEFAVGAAMCESKLSFMQGHAGTFVSNNMHKIPYNYIHNYVLYLFLPILCGYRGQPP